MRYSVDDEDTDGLGQEEAELRAEMDGGDDEDEDPVDDGERGLEETLEKLGFGAYHWRLLVSLDHLLLDFWKDRCWRPHRY